MVEACKFMSEMRFAQIVRKGQCIPAVGYCNNNQQGADIWKNWEFELMIGRTSYQWAPGRTLYTIEDSSSRLLLPSGNLYSL